MEDFVCGRVSRGAGGSLVLLARWRGGGRVDIVMDHREGVYEQSLGRSSHTSAWKFVRHPQTRCNKHENAHPRRLSIGFGFIKAETNEKRLEEIEKEI